MKVTVSFDQITGAIKPMHAVVQVPFTGGFNQLNFTPIQILKDAHIPYARLHDVGGPFGGFRYVDIPNLFRDFSADENDPASYDFAFTDELIKGMMSYGVAPYFRLGVTIENQCNIKAYRIYPPENYGKWARICEHVIRHYNEGWADGFHFDIKYWEIWGEPDNRPDPMMNQLWRGTAEQYYALYDVAAKHLKACFGDSIKVGGYSACGFYGIFADPEKYGLSVPKREGERYKSEKEEYRLAFLYGFMDYIKERSTPIDFFSWHTYDGIDTITVEADFVAKVLEQYGLGHIETHLNEWNLSHNRKINRDTSYASANVMAIMLAMQHKPTDMLMYYDAKYLAVGAYGGFYNLSTYAPSCVYYAFRAFGDLYDLGNEVQCHCEGERVYALAAANGEKQAVAISNLGQATEMELALPEGFNVYVLDQDHMLTKTDWDPAKFTLEENTVVLIKNFG